MSLEALTPSKTDFLRYDAQTYDQDGFLQVSGRVCELAQKPRYWQITATAKTMDPTTGELQKSTSNLKRIIVSGSMN